MRYIVMHKVDVKMEAGVPPDHELVKHMGRLVGESLKQGIFIDGAGLHRSARRVRLRCKGGSWDVEQGIKMLTSEGADLFGLESRGRLVEGAYADINVIDYDNLELQAPEYVYDFPDGAGRWIQKAKGYDLTLVNGAVFMRDGQHQGPLAGRMLRA